MKKILFLILLLLFVSSCIAFGKVAKPDALQHFRQGFDGRIAIGEIKILRDRQFSGPADEGVAKRFAEFWKKELSKSLADKGFFVVVEEENEGTDVVSVESNIGWSYDGLYSLFAARTSGYLRVRIKLIKGEQEAEFIDGQFLISRALPQWWGEKGVEFMLSALAKGLAIDLTKFFRR